MIRKFSLSALAVSMFASLVSAEIGFDGATRATLADELSDIQVAAAGAPAAAEDKGVLDWLLGKKQPAEWTIMLFSNAKNDLERFLLSDINEMEMIGSTDKVNIVVQVGRIDGYDESDGDWKGVRRYFVTKDTDTAKMGSTLVQDLGMKDMGDYKSLVEFGKWAKKTYPAKRYMLIVSNHGSGWEKGVERPIITKGISYDEQSGNHINTPQLGQALREIGKVDVFSTDACLMQMAEVVYEIKDSADYIVGSEETEPGDGYTYNDLLGPLAARPTMTARELGKLTVDAYSDHYDKIRQGYTQALARGGAAVNGLLPVTNAFVDAMMASGEKALAVSARDAAINYAVDENRDLYDFTRRVVEVSQNADVKAKGQALMSYITGTLVLHSRARDSQGGFWSGPKEYTLSRGMAAYFPNGSLADGYADLAWAKASKWDEFVLWLNN